MTTGAHDRRDGVTPERDLPVLCVRHVEWERPHRIGEALARRVPIVEADVLGGDELPPVDEVCGAVFMGGPMNADETGRYPGLAVERAWVERALAADLPLLGVCLGSQLIARALGAEVVPGERPELGWAPVEIFDSSDPVLGALAPATTVLHWHGDVFGPPPGATALARSRQTSCQAFRRGRAWGILFHPEADRTLVDRWLAAAPMSDEARAVLGPSFAEWLRADATAHEVALVERSAQGFEAFAELVADHRRERLAAAAPADVG